MGGGGGGGGGQMVFPPFRKILYETLKWTGKHGLLDTMTWLWVSQQRLPLILYVHEYASVPDHEKFVISICLRTNLQTIVFTRCLLHQYLLD